MNRSLELKPHSILLVIAISVKCPASRLPSRICSRGISSLSTFRFGNTRLSCFFVFLKISCSIESQVNEWEISLTSPCKRIEQKTITRCFAWLHPFGFYCRTLRRHWLLLKPLSLFIVTSQEILWTDFNRSRVQLLRVGMSLLPKLLWYHSIPQG